VEEGGAPSEVDVTFIATEPSGIRVAFARCPSCRFALRIHEWKLGQPVRCVNIDCGLKFIVKPEPALTATLAPPPKPRKRAARKPKGT
jgi:hypothetical protein